MISFLTSVPAISAIIILTILGVIIGSDNVRFLDIATGKLQGKQKSNAFNTSLLLGLILRIGLALVAFWALSLVAPFWEINLSWFNAELSGESLLLLVGGLFLLFKATSEIHEEVEDRGFDARKLSSEQSDNFGKSLLQSTYINTVFSFDVVLLAVGLANGLSNNNYHVLAVIVIGLSLSYLILILFKNKLHAIFSKHPSLSILGLGLLLLVGFVMFLEGAYTSVMHLFGSPIGNLPKSYVYITIALALALMFMNVKLRKESADGKIIS